MPQTLGKYHLGRTIGSGASCKVKIARTDDDNKRYAVKILKADQRLERFIKNEVEILRKLSHPNIVNFVEMGNDTLRKVGKLNKQVDYIVLELAEGGELFDFVCNSGHFSELVARTYFHQMMDALKYMHSAGICHRDLKPENIMLDHNFCMKIADFGFAAPTIGKDKSGQLHTFLGT